MEELFKLLFRLDDVLKEVVGEYGVWTYAILFAIIFCETGLVVTPILPGDSLLFAVGAFAGQPDSPLNIWMLMAVLFVAAVLYVIPYVSFPSVRKSLKWQHLPAPSRAAD